MDNKNIKTSRFRKGLELFLTFMKIGAFTFGGGYAMIPMIQREIVEKKGWITDEDILEIVAIAESTPGPIAVNSATFVGYRVAGVFGSFCATFGVVLPSFLIISLIALVLRQFRELKAVKYAFYGIRAGVLALIIKALVSMYKKSPKGWASYVIMAASFAIAAFTELNVLYIIIGCAVFGLVTSVLMKRRDEK